MRSRVARVGARLGRVGRSASDGFRTSRGGLGVLARRGSPRARLDCFVRARGARPSRDGGPPDLVARAHDAARDEVAHARDAYAVASRFAGRTLGPTGLPEARSFVAETTEATLRRLGVEAIVDGVVGEGAAARGLMEAAESCVDPGLAEILRRTSVDEARHAELAWDVFVWVRARGVRGLEWHVDEALAKLSRSTSSVRSPHRPALDLSRFGVLRDGREAAIILEAVANVRARVAAGSGGAVGGATERRAS